MRDQTIVVGVTGAGENDDALRYAAAVARSTGAGITLLHVADPVLPPVPTATVLPETRWSQRGREVVEEARADLERLGEGDLPVEVAVEVGDPGWVLGGWSADASLVVLQHRALGAVTRVLTGSTVATVAAQAQCPVVSVPAGQDQRENGLVVAGVLEDGGPREVGEVAAAEADRRGAGVRLLHAWRLAPDYDDLLLDDERWVADMEAALGARARELAEKHPEVRFDTVVRHHWPADTLVAATKEADLVVIGRHRARRFVPPRLGGTGRAVVRHAECPVMIVPV